MLLTGYELDILAAIDRIEYSMAGYARGLRLIFARYARKVALQKYIKIRLAVPGSNSQL